MMIQSLQVAHNRIFHYVERELKDEDACVLVCVLNCSVKDLVRIVGWCEDWQFRVVHVRCDGYLWCKH